MAADLITRIFTTPRPNHGRARTLDDFGRGGVDNWDLFYDSDPFRINYLDTRTGTEGISLFDRGSTHNRSRILQYAAQLTGLANWRADGISFQESFQFPANSRNNAESWIASRHWPQNAVDQNGRPTDPRTRSWWSDETQRSADGAEWAVRNSSFSLTPEVITWSSEPAGGGLRTTLTITRDQWLGNNGEEEQKQARRNLWTILRNGGQNLEISGWQHQNVQSWRNRDGRGATRNIVSHNTDIDNLVSPTFQNYGPEIKDGRFTFSINSSINLDNIRFEPFPSANGGNFTLVPTSLSASEVENQRAAEISNTGASTFRRMTFQTPGQAWENTLRWSEQGTQETTNSFGFRRSNSRGGSSTTRNEFSAGISATVTAEAAAEWPGGSAGGSVSTTANFGSTHERSAQRNWSQDTNFDSGSEQTQRSVYTHEGEMTNRLDTAHLRQLDMSQNPLGSVAQQWGGVINRPDPRRPLLDQDRKQIYIPNWQTGVLEPQYHLIQFVDLWESGMPIVEFLERGVVNHEFKLNGEWAIDNNNSNIGRLNVPVTQTVLGHTSSLNHQTLDYDLRQALFQAYNHGAMDIQSYPVGNNIGMNKHNINFDDFAALSVNPVYLSNISGVKTRDFAGHTEHLQAGVVWPLQTFCTGSNRYSNLCAKFANTNSNADVSSRTSSIQEYAKQQNETTIIDLNEYLPRPASEMKDENFLESLGVDLEKDYVINGLAFTNDSLPVRIADHKKLKPYAVEVVGTSLRDYFQVSEDFSDVNLYDFESSYIRGSDQSDNVVARKGNHNNHFQLGEGSDVLHVSGDHHINLGDGRDTIHYFGGKQNIALGAGNDQLLIRKIPNRKIDFYVNDFNLFDDLVSCSKRFEDDITYAMTPRQNGKPRSFNSIDMFYRDELIGTIENADASLLDSIGEIRLAASLSGKADVIERIDRIYQSGSDISPAKYFDKVILNSGLFGSKRLVDPHSFDEFNPDKKLKILRRLAQGTDLPYTNTELEQLAAYATTDNLAEVVDNFYSASVDASGDIVDNYSFG